MYVYSQNIDKAITYGLHNNTSCILYSLFSLTLSILFIQWHSKIVKGRYNITKTYPYIKKFEWFRTILQSNYVLRLCDHYGKTSKQNISKDSLLCDKHLFCAIGQLKSRDRIIIFHYSLSFFCVMYCNINLFVVSHALLGRISYFKPQIVSFLHQIKKLSPKRMR